MKIMLQTSRTPLNTCISKNADLSSHTIFHMATQLKIYMQLIMQPYSPPETNQASIFGGISLLLFSTPNFYLMILLLLMHLDLHNLLSLVGSPKVHGKIAIFGLMTNIFTYKTSNVTKE